MQVQYLLHVVVLPSGSEKFNHVCMDILFLTNSLPFTFPLNRNWDFFFCDGITMILVMILKKTDMHHSLFVSSPKY
jgi:hypothetical protein